MTEKPQKNTHVHPAGRYLPPLALALVGVILYANSLSGPFFFDDHVSISENSHIRQLWPPLWLTAASTNSPLQGRPVVSFSMALNYALNGMNVRGYHIYNIVIHILCAWTLFGIVRRTLTGPKLTARFGRSATGLAFTCALLWMLHPLLTECVNYVTQRTESMMSLFYLLTLYCAIGALESAHRFRWYAAAVLACCCGMASKEVMVTAPLMVVVYDLIFSADSFNLTLRRRWPLYLGLAAGWVVLAALMISFPLTNAGFSVTVGPWDYAKNQCLIIVHYLRLALSPHPLALDYGYPASLSLAQVAPYGALLLALLAATVLALIRRPMIGFLGVWFFVILGPTSSFAPMTTEVGAERRMYLPLASLIVLLVFLGHWFLARLPGRFSRPGQPASDPVPHRFARTIRYVMVLAVASAWSFLTVLRNTDYRTEISLWQSAVRAIPQNSRAHNNLGNAYQKAGQLQHAFTCYHQALRIFPDLAPAHNNLAIALQSQGQFEQAIEHYRYAVQLGSDRPASFNALAWLLATAPAAGPTDPAETISFAQRAAELTDYQDASILDTLAAAYASAGRFDQAVITAQKALALAHAAQQHQLAGDIAQRLKLYQNAKPFRLPEIKTRGEKQL